MIAIAPETINEAFSNPLFSQRSSVNSASESSHRIFQDCDESTSQDPSQVNSDRVALVCPRRKKNSSEARKEAEDPVVLTRELLESLFNLPLSSASERLGICPTAIKKACRKLGIPKWPFKNQIRRGAVKEQGDTTPSPSNEIVDRTAQQRSDNRYHTVSDPEFASGLPVNCSKDGSSSFWSGEFASFQGFGHCNERVLFLTGGAMDCGLKDPFEEDMADELFWREIQRALPSRVDS
eukprot:767928-Hanusia_phi.AAC.2